MERLFSILVLGLMATGTIVKSQVISAEPSAAVVAVASDSNPRAIKIPPPTLKPIPLTFETHIADNGTTSHKLGQGFRVAPKVPEVSAGPAIIKPVEGNLLVPVQKEPNQQPIPIKKQAEFVVVPKVVQPEPIVSSVDPSPIQTVSIAQAQPEIQAVPIPPTQPAIEAVPVPPAQAAIQAVPIPSATPGLQAVPVPPAQTAVQAVPIPPAAPVLQAVPFSPVQAAVQAVPILPTQPAAQTVPIQPAPMAQAASVQSTPVSQTPFTIQAVSIPQASTALQTAGALSIEQARSEGQAVPIVQGHSFATSLRTIPMTRTSDRAASAVQTPPKAPKTHFQVSGAAQYQVIPILFQPQQQQHYALVPVNSFLATQQQLQLNYGQQHQSYGLWPTNAFHHHQAIQRSPSIIQTPISFATRPTVQYQQNKIPPKTQQQQSSQLWSGGQSSQVIPSSFGIYQPVGHAGLGHFQHPLTFAIAF